MVVIVKIIKRHPLVICAFILVSIIAIKSFAFIKYPEFIPLTVEGYNHTATGIGEYIVSINNSTGIDIGYLGAGEGGGSSNCCVSIPRKWNSNLTVSVAWSVWKKDDKKREFSRTISVPEYNFMDVSRLNIHFLRSGEVKVFVSKYGLRNRNYPLKGKEAELKPGEPIELVE